MPPSLPLACRSVLSAFVIAFLAAGGAATVGAVPAASTAGAATGTGTAGAAPFAAALRLQNAAGFAFAPADVALFLRNTKTGKHLFLAPSEIRRDGAFGGELAGETVIGGATLTFRVKIALDPQRPFVALTPSWRVTGADLAGWEFAFAYQRGFDATGWRAQCYPFAGNSAHVDINPLRYCGIPGVLLYTPNLANVIFFALDTRADYLNPTTWTGKTRFAFADGSVNPCYYVGGKEPLFKKDFLYELPVQVFFDNSGSFKTALPNIIRNWMAAANYKVEPLSVRTPQEAADMVFKFRRNPSHWVEGIGFKHNNLAPFCYPGEYPIFAIYDYKIWLKTKDEFWRERAFKHIAYLLKGQQPNGAFHTTYDLGKRGIGHGYAPDFKKHNKNAHSKNIKSVTGFNSMDWGHFAYKPDINALTCKNLFAFWKLVKDTEGTDNREWFDAAKRCLDWILKQQNDDGGFAQCVDIVTGEKCASTVCGRILAALPNIAKITGDTRCLEASARQEKFLRENVLDKLWVTGAHPDLPPTDFEQDSLHNITAFFLDKYERTGDKEALEMAVANAHFAMFYWCPKQLSWVKHPTQLAHSEQVSYNTYAVYTYDNEKTRTMHRLHKHTNDPLFLQLRDRIIQNCAFTQSTDPKWLGSMSEAIADPWLERRQGFNYTGVIYPNQTVQFILELFDIGLAK